jgi:predicted porin
MADAGGNTYFGLSQGLFNGSRWGLRGTEQLIDSINLKGIYTLEGGVVIPNGTFDQNGQIFGRAAWLGLKSDYGTLTFGRQYGEFYDAIAAGDVFPGHGNLGYWSSAAGTAPDTNNFGANDAVNDFFAQEMGNRWDYSVRYDVTFSGVTVGVMAMPGNVPNGTTVGWLTKNAMVSARVAYSSPNLPISGAIGIQEEADVNFNNHLDLGGGLKFAFDPTDAVYLFYIHSQYASNFARINSNDSEFSSGLGFGRTDNIVNLAVNYYVLPALNLIASFYFDYAQNVLSYVDDGQRYSGLLVADYYFSKDFDVYIGAWYTQFVDSFQQTSNGGDEFATATGLVPDVFGAILGMRFRF